MKIDTSWLQAGALLIIGTVSLIAALQQNWTVAGTALTGLFALVNLNRQRTMPEPPTDPIPPPPAAQTGA